MTPPSREHSLWRRRGPQAERSGRGKVLCQDADIFKKHGWSHVRGSAGSQEPKLSRNDGSPGMTAAKRGRGDLV